ncbi:uncharacterized protein RAG0_08230 [Rhynchosporium agropyri]|uniref:Uncharacterized protein n=1 Tax=Rhynchosporium agropyri TaxID=914238 RepID=A0A1E1KQ03_9HELO|nr:uncharacterized protein RAG0_08230 [Rhynchosporium agropyri]
MPMFTYPGLPSRVRHRQGKKQQWPRRRAALLCGLPTAQHKDPVGLWEMGYMQMLPIFPSNPYLALDNEPRITPALVPSSRVQSTASRRASRTIGQGSVLYLSLAFAPVGIRSAAQARSVLRC